MKGSSPLTRGKLGDLPKDCLATRLIPAHAGKTLPCTSLLPKKRAHPRSRGENSKTISPVVLEAGSSPLTRGKPAGPFHDVRLEGLIPAHAGKTRRSSLSRHGAAGSSPLTRGKLSTEGMRSTASWLIPAHAGKTRNARILGNKLGAHPRSRGENALKRAARNNDGWLIPAHAGKTPAGKAVACPTWAHPRSRGENPRALDRAPDLGGSSPLTRGKRCVCRVDGVVQGLIPAHAGKTGISSSSTKNPRAHPRSRGENRGRPGRNRAGPGSSPLTRGKPRPPDDGGAAGGLIPAHAGKTGFPEWS